MSPLTRVDALVAAAILDHDPEREPSWDGIAARLREWAHTQPAATEPEEGEMPSQSTNHGQMESTMEASNRTAPGERVNARTEGLTTDFLGV